MVHQRLAGLVLVVLAFVAVLSTSAWRPRVVQGALLVPPPPAVGDCWTPLPTDPAVDAVLAADRVPPLTAAPCSGPRVGEVVEVENQRRYSQAEAYRCVAEAQRYLGLPAALTREMAYQDGTTQWLSPVRPLALTFGPRPDQVAAGQLWSACVVIGVGVGFAGQRFSGTVRRLAQRGGTAFAPFAVCSQAPVVHVTVPCDAPHRYEVFAESYDLGADEAASTASCREQVAQQTGLADPTAGGRLVVELLPYAYDQTSGSESRAATYAEARASDGRGLICVVRPTDAGKRLTDTLHGIGERPLPLR